MSEENVQQQNPVDTLTARASRPGWTFLVPGSCLKAASGFLGGTDPWSAEQRANGVVLGCNYLTSTEEEDILVELQKAGRLATIGSAQVKKALATIDGKPIPHMEKRNVWEALGPQGRSIAMAMFQQATNPSKEEVDAVQESFRVAG